MANWNKILLTSDNDKRFDIITKKKQFNSNFATKGIYRSTPGTVYLRSANGIPHDDIKELSIQNPDMTFKARYSFEHNVFSVVHVVQYCAGKYEVIDIDHNYSIASRTQYEKGVKREISNEQAIGLLEQAIEIFKRIDIKKRDSEGNLIDIDFYMPLVVVTVHLDEFEMKASKRGFIIGELRIGKKEESMSFWPKPIAIKNYA